MNEPITKLDRRSQDVRAFSVFFAPDINHEEFEVGMNFEVVSVNRLTGEIKFSLDGTIKRKDL